MKRRRGIGRKFFFILGIVLCSYPLLSNAWETRKQSGLVKTYQANTREKGNKEEILESARHYNDILKQTWNMLVENPEATVWNGNYREQLNMNGDGMMGVVEIPKVEVNLPIWHGTEEEAILNGAGHLEGTSLPVGGRSTRCVLTSHRGLPGAKLFTRLDELVEGDLFFIRVCGETLAYEVKHIEVIEPDELEKLKILEGKDMVTLVTCTPYGRNTHRLVVDGERTEYRESVYEKIRPQIPSLREVCFAMVPFILVVMAMIEKWKVRKRRCRKHEKKNEMCRAHSELYSVRVSHRGNRSGRRGR